MIPRTVQLFAPPRSSVRIRRRSDEVTLALEKRGVTVLRSQGALHPLTIDDRADHVCAVGGDGTLRYVIDAVRRLDRQISISVYPAGTVNLIARELGFPRNVPDFVERLLSDRRSSPAYVAMAGDLPLLACASVGPDSYAVALLSTHLKRLMGRTAYLIAFARVLGRWPRSSILVSCENAEFRCAAVYVAKGRFYAGPFSFAPSAALEQPMLHVLTFETLSRVLFLRFAWRLFRRRSVAELKGVTQLTCSSLTLRSDGPAPIQTDGDVLYELPIRISIDPSPFNML